MYKINVASGLGDCLRRINNCRVIAMCLKSNTKCQVSYKPFIVEEPAAFEINNKQALITLIDKSDVLEYIEYPQFLSSPATAIQYDQEVYETEKLDVIPVSVDVSEIAASFKTHKINIALQIRGGDGVKEFGKDMIVKVLSAFDLDVYQFHVIDKPSNFLKNKEFFNRFKNVVCRNLDFAENYKLITLCDLLIAPDSFSKYAAHAANKKMVILCCIPSFLITVDHMFEWCHRGMTNNSNVIHLGQTNYKTLTDKLSDISAEEIVSAVHSLLS
jgi:hypothetical protein